MSRFWNPLGRTDLDFSDPVNLRRALLDFIADFSNCDNSTDSRYLETARALTQSAHESLGGTPGTRPLVVDPFAGGGAIPLEALRVGADAFASDLNPVAVLLNKVVLEYIPRYGQKLADEVRKWGEWIKVEAEKELAEFYPKDPDGATPIAYLWARTIVCEGPGCGAEVPLMRSLWLAKKGKHSVALKMLPDREKKKVDFEILHDVQDRDVGQGTIRRGSATCPVCGYTTPVASVRRQLKARRGGAADARLFCVVTTKLGQQGRFYRLPTEKDLATVRRAAEELERRKAEHTGSLSLVPDEPTEQYHTFVNRGPIYGMVTWQDFFTSRQGLALTTLVHLVREAGKRLDDEHDNGFAAAVQTLLACTLDREAEHSSSLCRWNSTGQKIQATFGRQSLPMVWDFSEANILGNSVGSWDNILETTLIPFETASHFSTIGSIERSSATSYHLPDGKRGIAENDAGMVQNEFENGKRLAAEHEARMSAIGQTGCYSATSHPLPNDSASAFITDPPYYYSVQYADLSDFFYVWLRRILSGKYPELFGTQLTSKDNEIIVQSPGHEFSPEGKNNAFYESQMKIAMVEGRRILEPFGIGIIVFAHTSTRGWEAMLHAMIDAGWIITASWPIDTEMANRVLAQNRSVLASSIHLVCRPRENPDGSVREDDIGDWRDVLSELPQRIHAWLPRLAQEGIVGADAIFSCLGPALEIYSRYSRVEKASGEAVSLREYLEEVWAAVSREALGMIFEGAEATGLEEDARLTAMWLWTLSTGSNGWVEDQETDDAEDEEPTPKSARLKGFVLEYDAARKIAQGLGAHLENLTNLVEVKGNKARLLPVSERARYLFNKAEVTQASPKRKKQKPLQITLSGTEVKAEQKASSIEVGLPSPGSTVLDRLHQAMLLFADGRGEALKRFLLEEIGSDQRVWSLAQSLSALYPTGSEERRWVEGVLTRKKSLGL
jgi:adenine-specific DNA methylase